MLECGPFCASSCSQEVLRSTFSTFLWVRLFRRVDRRERRCCVHPFAHVLVPPKSQSVLRNPRMHLFRPATSFGLGGGRHRKVCALCIISASLMQRSSKKPLFPPSRTLSTASPLLEGHVWRCQHNQAPPGTVVLSAGQSDKGYM